MNVVVGLPLTMVADSLTVPVVVTDCRPVQDALRPGQSGATGNSEGRVGERRSSSRDVVQRIKTAVRRRTQCAQGKAAQWKSRMKGWRKTQFGQGVSPGNRYVREKDEERSPATGQAVRGQPGGNRVAMVSVRPVVADEQSMGKPRRRR